MEAKDLEGLAKAVNEIIEIEPTEDQRRQMDEFGDKVVRLAQRLNLDCPVLGYELLEEK